VAEMKANPKREQVDKEKTEGVEIKMVPKGTFAGTRKKAIVVQRGEPQPEDTGDQGGGQN
jgi:hypothetical protein